MHKSNLLLISALTLVASSCSSRDESKPLFGEPADATTITDTSTDSSTDTQIDGSTDVASLGAANSDTGLGSTQAQGDNPGEVPIGFLADVADLNVTEQDAPRGYKIFAGNEIRGVFPGTESEVEFAYLNLTFPCVADALFESYPSPLMADTADYMLGGFVWSPLVAGGDTDIWNLDVRAILAGDDDHSIIEDDITVYPVNFGDIIVGYTTINKLVVTRIVQYEECISG